MGEYTSVVVALVGVAGMLAGAWFARRAARNDAASSAVAVAGAKVVANGAAERIHRMDVDAQFTDTVLAQVVTLQTRMDRYDVDRETVRQAHDAERSSWGLKWETLRADCHRENEVILEELVATRQELMTERGRVDRLTALLDQEGTRKWLDSVRRGKDAESPDEGGEA